MTMLPKPPTETDTVYSNLDHQLNQPVAEQLKANPGKVYAQHAAWDFCGYVWLQPDGRWVDQVWRWNAPVEDITGDTIEDVIQQAIGTYGSE